MPALASRPSILQDLMLHWNDFWILNDSRPIGMVVQPIPISEILAYAKYFKIENAGERKLLLKRVRILDKVFLDWNTEKKDK